MACAWLCACACCCWNIACIISAPPGPICASIASVAACCAAASGAGAGDAIPAAAIAAIIWAYPGDDAGDGAGATPPANFNGLDATGAASVDPAPVDPPPTSPDDPISAMALSASRPGATARCGVGAERCDRAASPSALRGRLISPGSDAGSDRDGSDLDGDPPPPPPPRLDLPRLEPGRSGTPPADAVKFAAAVMAAIDAAASNGEPTRGAGGVIARPATLGMNHWGLYAGAPAGPAGEDEDVAAANACAAAAAAAAGGWPGSVLTPRRRRGLQRGEFLLDAEPSKRGLARVNQVRLLDEP